MSTLLPRTAVFVVAADTVVSLARGKPVEQGLAESFATFVSAATALLESQPPAPAELHQPEAPTEAFSLFITEATELVLADLESQLGALADRTSLVRRWATPHDLLHTAGFRGCENAYTELMAWALSPPETTEAVRLRLQRAWLGRLGLLDALSPSRPTSPRTQLRTGNGIPDLVLEYPAGVVVVEAKTGTGEHGAPDGTPQTLAYADAVRETLGLPASRVVCVVYLTPDGREAKNSEAIVTRYSDFVFALALALEDRIEAEASLRQAFSILFSHLLRHADRRVDLVHLATEVSGILVECHSCDARGELARHLDVLADALDLLPEVGSV